MGRVGFGGFVILRPKPNPTCYKKKIFVTQPNPQRLKNRPNPAGRVGLGRVWRDGGFSAHPYLNLLRYAAISHVGHQGNS